MLDRSRSLHKGFYLVFPETLTIRGPSYRERRVNGGGIPVSRGWLAFLWAVIGAVVGQLIGSALAEQIRFLNYHLPLGFGPAILDLNFLVVTLGIQIKLTIGGAIGLVLALWLALRH